MTFDSDHGQAYNREAQALLPPGLLSADIAESLARDPNPALILAMDGRTPLWSSHEAARRFGYRDAQSLMRARLPATAPGTQRLEQIGAEGLEISTPRLERLRYFIGFRGVVLTVLCRVIPLLDGREAILVAFPLAGTVDTRIGDGAAPISRTSALEPTASEPFQAPDATIPQPVFFERDLAILPASDLIRQARAMLGKDQNTGSDRIPSDIVARQNADTHDEPPEDELVHEELVHEELADWHEEPLRAQPETVAAIAPVEAMPPVSAFPVAPFGSIPVLNPAAVNAENQPAPARHKQPALPSRFLFALDTQGRLTRDVSGIATLAGADGLIAGASFADVLDEIDPAAAAAVRAGIASGETWQPITLAWPMENHSDRVAVRLSALPLVDATAGLTGFSGFGRLGAVSSEAITILHDDSVSEPLDQAAAQPAVIAPVALGMDTAEISPMLVQGPLAAAGLAGSVLDWSDDTDTATIDGIEDDASATDHPDTDESEGLPSGEFDAAAWHDSALDFGKLAALDAAEESAAPISADDLMAAAAQATPLLDDERDADDDTTADEDLTGTTSDGDPLPTAFDTAEFASRITPFPLPGGRRKADPPGPQNVVSIHNGQPSPAMPGFQRQGLSMTEKNAFREIARALGARFAGGDESESITSPLAASGGRGNTSIARSEQEAHAASPEPEQTSADREQDNIAGGPNPHFGLGDGVAGFLDRLPLGLMVLKGEQPLFVNRTLLDLTAYPDFASFIRENGARAIFRKGIAPREESRLPDPMVLATRDGEMVPVDAQLQLVDWDGSPATLISVRRAVELEQGKALRTVAMDLKRARAESHELRAILDTATDGVLTLDAAGQVLTMNGTAQALFGLHQNEIVGEHFTRLLANESHAIAMDYLDGLKLGGVRSVLNDGREVQGCEKNGGKMPLFMTLGRISEDDPPRFCAVLRDITAWKRAETDLTEARRVAELASAKKSDFLAKISHEIRTPMNAIIGFSEVMQEERLGPLGTAKYKEYLTDIRTSGQHVVSLVNDLLDLAKIEAGRMELDFQATDLNAIVQSAVQIIQPQANTARVLVRSQLAQKLPPVVADERSVRQIVLNILSNATRFTESGGQVIVSTSLLEGGEAVIRIRDTGIGMSAPEIEQALEPFRQVGQKRNKGGTGLGLPLTKALVEANRANFAIRSQPGEGTLVEVAFPSTRVLAE